VAFAGFPAEGLRFFDQLERNNERAWFHAHRDEYEANVLEPARELVVAIGRQLAKFADDVHADPRVGGSIMRTARDTRFSRDKTPYKPHLDLWFWQGAGPSRERPGYWFRLTPKALLLGAGKHHFARDDLARYREAVAADETGVPLARAVAKVERAGGFVGGREYKRVPRGFDPGHPRSQLLMHSGLFGGLELPVPPELGTGRFPALCARHYRRLSPIQEWLVESLG
jgi:uncharacterized protein (TIGR02453 family)